MSGPGGIGGNRPTNNIVSYPSTSPNSKLDVNDPELNEHGRFVAEQQAQAKTVALADGPQRTAQAQPPGKSFTETMGAAFSAMGAAVTNFFKGLGDRIATIEMPSLPRISLRRQEAAQASPAAERAPMKPQLAGQLVQLEGRFKAAGSDPQKLAMLLAPPAGSMLGKAITAHAAEVKDIPNLNFVRGLGTGITLSELREKYIFPELGTGNIFSEKASSDGGDAALNLDAPKLNALMKSLDAAIASGLGDVKVTATFDPDAQTFRVGIQGFRADESSIESTSLMVGLQTQMAGAHKHVMNEMVTNSFGVGSFSNGLFKENNPTMTEARNLASEGASAMRKSNDNEQAELATLNSMSTPEFAQALQADPSLARRLPEMALGSEARQAFMTYAVAQPPGTTLQDKVAGFYSQVKDQMIQESLAAGGMMDAPVQAPAALPSVHLDSLAHVLPLSADAVALGKNMEGLQAFMTNVEHNNENLDFLATGTALLRFENALGHEVPANFAVGKPGAASLSLNFDLPAVRQWAEQFVGDDAPTQANLPGPQATALQQALNSMPDDAASATDAQRSALTTAMANCLATVASSIIFDIRPRYEAA